MGSATRKSLADCVRMPQQCWTPLSRRHRGFAHQDVLVSKDASIPETAYNACCVECLNDKVPSIKKKAPHSSENAAVLLDTPHMNHLAPFVHSTSSNMNIIVAIDGFTKFGILL